MSRSSLKVRLSVSPDTGTSALTRTGGVVSSTVTAASAVPRLGLPTPAVPRPVAVAWKPSSVSRTGAGATKCALRVLPSTSVAVTPLASVCDHDHWRFAPHGLGPAVASRSTRSPGVAVCAGTATVTAGAKVPNPGLVLSHNPHGTSFVSGSNTLSGSVPRLLFENLSRRSSVSRSNTPGGNVVSSFARRSNPWSDVNRLNTFPGNTAMSLTCSSSSVSAVSRLNTFAGSAAMSLPFSLSSVSVATWSNRSLGRWSSALPERSSVSRPVRPSKSRLCSESTSSPETSSVSIWARSAAVTSSQETLGAGTARWMASSTLGW